MLKLLLMTYGKVIALSPLVIEKLNMLKYLSILLLSMFSVACGHKEKIVVETKVIAVVVHKEHFNKPSLPPPPDKQEYLQASDRQRTGLLKVYADNLQGHIAKLYAMLDSIESNMNKTKQTLEKDNKP